MYFCFSPCLRPDGWLHQQAQVPRPRASKNTLKLRLLLTIDPIFQTILITGGSEGMGLELGILLAQKGASIIIVARTISKLEAAVKKIQASAVNISKQRFYFLSTDLTSPEAVKTMMTAAIAWNANTTPDIVFCCAGASHPGLFAELSTRDLKNEMDTDYFSAAYTAHAAIQGWLSTPSAPATKGKTTQEPKHIVFVSSLLAFLPLAGYTPYTPAKTALRALSETLAQEMLLYAHHTPIESHCVFPGTIFTAGYEREQLLKSGITKKLEEADEGQSAAEAARETLNGLERGEGTVVTSGWLGMAMRSGMLGGSRRSGFGIVDTVLAWVIGIVLIFVRRDMDSKVIAWGTEKRMGEKVDGG